MEYADIIGSRVNGHPDDDVSSESREQVVHPAFDPNAHLRQLEDGRDYMDLKWRILWLRSNEPEARIESQIVPATEDEIVCRATITLRGGASASAHGSALRSEEDSAVERAENRAIARALASARLWCRIPG